MTTSENNENSNEIISLINTFIKLRERNIEERKRDIKFLLSKVSKDKATTYGNPEKFYDLVIKLNSLHEAVSKNLKVYVNDTRYKLFKDKTTVVVGVLGQFNKGKTHIIKQLSFDESLASGYSVSTEGLSIKYPHDANLGLTLLDVAGFETAIQHKNSKDTKNYIDRIHTENFLQKFVIMNSDIIILVVNKLTYTDQKMLNRIKQLIIQNKLEKKEIYIFHNLAQYEKKSDVENYITKELTSYIKLKSEKMTSLENNRKNNEFFQEVQEEEFSSISIFHFIIAKEDTEAGRYYNESVYSQVNAKIKSVSLKKAFDPVNAFIIQFKEDFPFIFVKGKLLDEPKFNGKDAIIIKSSDDFKFQNILVNDLGVMKNNKIVERYKILMNEKELIFTFEIPRCDISTVKFESKREANGIRFYVSGKLKSLGFTGFTTLKTNIDENEEFTRDDIYIPYEMVVLVEKEYEKTFKNGILEIKVKIVDID
jgi:hypothetical protein